MEDSGWERYGALGAVVFVVASTVGIAGFVLWCFWTLGVGHLMWSDLRIDPTVAA